MLTQDSRAVVCIARNMAISRHVTTLVISLDRLVFCNPIRYMDRYWRDSHSHRNHYRPKHPALGEYLRLAFEPLADGTNPEQRYMAFLEDLSAQKTFEQQQQDVRLLTTALIMLPNIRTIILDSDIFYEDSPRRQMLGDAWCYELIDSTRKTGSHVMEVLMKAMATSHKHKPATVTEIRIPYDETGTVSFPKVLAKITPNTVSIAMQEVRRLKLNSIYYSEEEIKYHDDQRMSDPYYLCEDDDVASEDGSLQSKGASIESTDDAITVEDDSIEVEDNNFKSKDDLSESAENDKEVEDSDIECENDHTESHNIDSVDDSVENEDANIENEDDGFEGEDDSIESHHTDESDDDSIESRDDDIESEDDSIESEDDSIESGDDIVETDFNPFEHENFRFPNRYDCNESEDDSEIDPVERYGSTRMLGEILQSAKLLEDLTLTFVDDRCDHGQMYLRPYIPLNILKGTNPMNHLKRVSLGNFKLEEPEIVAFLLSISSSLQYLTIDGIVLDYGTWVSTFEKLKGRLPEVQHFEVRMDGLWDTGLEMVDHEDDEGLTLWERRDYIHQVSGWWSGGTHVRWFRDGEGQHPLQSLIEKGLVRDDECYGY